MNKNKLLICLIALVIVVTQVSLVSSLEFDNVVRYEKEKMKANIKNAFDLPIIGSDVGSLELKSHKSVNYIKRVSSGKEEVVMYYDFTGWIDGKESLGEVYFTNMSSRELIEKNYTFVIWESVTKNIPIWDWISVGKNLNGTDIMEYKIVRNEKKEIKDWVPMSDKKIKNGRIGLKTYVDKGDFIDGVWEVAGVKISEHSSWTTDLNTNIVGYWKLDNDSLIDSVQGLTTTNGGSTNTSGIINSARNFNDTFSQNIDVSDVLDLNFDTGEFSISLWINSNDSIVSDGILIKNRLSAPWTGWTIRTGASNVALPTIAGSGIITGTTSLNDGLWHHVVWTRSSGGVNKLFVDGAQEGSNVTNAANLTYPVSMFMGRDPGFGGYLDGAIDEVAVWKGRELTTPEIVQIFNNSFGTTFSNATGPLVIAHSPENNTVFTTSPASVDLICFGEDEAGFSSMEFFLNGTSVLTNSSGINNTNYTFSTSLLDGSYNWSCTGTDSGAGQNSTETRFFSVNSTPFIEYLTPPTLVDNANHTENFIPIKVNVSSNNLENITFFLVNTNGTSLNQTFTNSTFDINFTGISDGSYDYNVTVCPNTTATCNSTETRRVNKDSVFPIIVIEAPNATIGLGQVGSNETLNVTFNDTNLDICWFNYNGTNVTIDGCISGVKNSTQFILETGNTNMTVYANDTFGNENSTFISWEYKVLEINQTFNTEVTVGTSENFSAVINLQSGLSISAVALVYNGTADVGTSSALGDNIELSNENFVIPDVSADTNITFFWSLILSDSSVVNLSSQNQTILNLELGNCTAFTNEILNLTVVDEEEQTLLSNTTIEIALSLLSVDRSSTIKTLSGSFDNENPLGICLDKNLTAGAAFSMDAIIRYVAPGYANEYYNLVGSELTNETEVTNITLYDLNLTDSTEFQLTFTGRDALPEEEALVFVERQYIAENAFKTVELPKTDSNGQTVLHLVRNDVVYNIRIVKDDETLGTFLNIIAFCEDFTIGNCAINLNALTNTTGIFNYDEEVGVLYDAPPTYNSTTNDVSFAFTSADGTAKIVVMTVERKDIFGNTSVCSNTLASTSGTVTCDIGLNLTDTTLETTISIDGTTWLTSHVIIDETNYGSIGYVVWLIMAIGLVLMFSGSKNGILISLAVSYIGAVGMGIVIGGISGIGSAGIWILVITMIGIWKINKNRTS